MAHVAEFRYPETVSMLKQLRAEYGREADLAEVDPQRWYDSYLHRLPDDLRCTIDAPNGRISREMLYDLARASRESPGDVQALSKLFWNVLAWGISGDWRHIESIRDAIVEDPEQTMKELHLAQTASYEGRLKDAFRHTQGLIAGWGPSFTTKFLAFTADRNSKEPQAIVIDGRVQLAWTILIDSEGSKDLTPKRYERMCSRAADLAARNDMVPSELEESLFLFGQKVNSSERWITALLAEADVLPPATSVFGRMVAAELGRRR